MNFPARARPNPRVTPVITMVWWFFAAITGNALLYTSFPDERRVEFTLSAERRHGRLPVELALFAGSRPNIMGRPGRLPSGLEPGSGPIHEHSGSRRSS